jgi:hypothetical protein
MIQKQGHALIGKVLTRLVADYELAGEITCHRYERRDLSRH